MNTEAYDIIMSKIHYEMNKKNNNEKPDLAKVSALIKAAKCPYLLAYLESIYKTSST